MIIGLIPARYKSTRLPGKPMLKFGTKTMIQRVYTQSIKSKYLDKVYVVTDDERIKDNIESIGGNVLMVKEKCLNGTERICLALNKYSELFKDTHYIVNVQGDEPYINPKHIDIAIDTMINSINSNIKCSTLHYKIVKRDELFNTSIGKLVLDCNNCIMYCSRNCIPYNKINKPDLTKCHYFAHIGLFVFDINYLRNEYCNGNTPLQLEEDIEWLKILEKGYKIITNEVSNYEIGVNTQEDYDYLIKKYYD